MHVASHILRQLSYTESHCVTSSYTECVTLHYLTVLCTAKVDQFDHTPRIDHDVGTFDVAVNYAVVMEITQGIGDLPGVVFDGVAIQGAKPIQQELSGQIKVSQTLLGCSK